MTICNVTSRHTTLKPPSKQVIIRLSFSIPKLIIKRQIIYYSQTINNLGYLEGPSAVDSFNVYLLTSYDARTALNIQYRPV